MAESFKSTRHFFDNKNYPRGFSRHGDFTIKESQLLEQYGVVFNELALGKKEPETEEEKAFVEVCKGERPPTTEYEKVWCKYIAKISNPKRFHTLSGGKPQIDANDDFVDTDD